MAGYTRRFVQCAHESAVQIEDVGSDGPGVDDLEYVEGNVEGVVDAVAIGGEQSTTDIEAGEQVLVDGQGDCVAGTVHLGCGVAWIDLLAQCFRSALALKEGAESGVVLKNGGGEVQFDALGR